MLSRYLRRWYKSIRIVLVDPDEMCHLLDRQLRHLLGFTASTLTFRLDPVGCPGLEGYHVDSAILAVRLLDLAVFF